MTLSLLALLLAGHVAQVAAACDQGCQDVVDPVCVTAPDGPQSFANGCLAACAGFQASTPGYCEGELVRFTPTGATGGVIAADVISRYQDEGFTYRGHVQLAERHSGWSRERAPFEAAFRRSGATASAVHSLSAGGVISAAAEQPAEGGLPVALRKLAAAVGKAAAPAPKPAPGKLPAASNSTAKPGSSASTAAQRVTIMVATIAGKVTTMSYVYKPSSVSSYPAANPSKLPAAGNKPAGSPKPASSSSTSRAGRRRALLETGAGGGVSGAQQGRASAQPPHRQLSVIGADTRRRCAVEQFPDTAIGFLVGAVSAAGASIRRCTGTLISRQHVLTAAHCVYDESVGRFMDTLNFTPGQYKVSNGEVLQPYGVLSWDSITVFKQYVDDPNGKGLPYDIAVIKLPQPVGQQTGWLGLSSQCINTTQQPLALTLAGYPADRGPATSGFPAPGAPGGCLSATCKVRWNCTAKFSYHDCDSYEGQSGASMYDASARVRTVHTLGSYPGVSPLNEGITLTHFMVDQIARWAGLLKAS